MTAPTHLIMVVNRDTCDLTLVSAHDETEAEAAFLNLATLFATTRNDVHKVAIPVMTGFTVGDIRSARGLIIIEDKPTDGELKATPTQAKPSQDVTQPHKATNGIHRNAKGEYVQRLADGSEIISESDFSD